MKTTSAKKHDDRDGFTIKVDAPKFRMPRLPQRSNNVSPNGKRYKRSNGKRIEA